MPTGVIFCWGFVGGFVAAVFVYVLPSLVQAALTGEVRMTRGRAMAMLALVLFLSAAAGLVALIPDDVTRGQAISIGLGSQAVIKGIISGIRDSLPPAPPPNAPPHL